jgi:hypothetical protein
MIVVEEGHTAPGGFEEISVLVFSTVDRLCIET